MGKVKKSGKGWGIGREVEGEGEQEWGGGKGTIWEGEGHEGEEDGGMGLKGGEAAGVMEYKGPGEAYYIPLT